MLSRVFKKLDLLIVKAFIGPFVATFFITTFVLVLQFMWLYIDDVVGKGLDMYTVLRLLMYVAATMVPLALPLAVLLSSIMTLGNLGETYELVAIKSAGISLLRFLQPLAILSVIITLVAFFFNNNVLPVAKLKMETLKADIINTKPAFDIKEGVFFDRIPGFVIKIGKKEQDDSTIRKVVIYEQSPNGQQDNMIVADSGTMVVTADKQNLIFTLKSGWRYQEKGDRTVNNGTELVRMGFKNYKKVLDLSTFKVMSTNDSNYRSNYQMQTIIQLGKRIDSLKKVVTGYTDQIHRNASSPLKFPAYLDTTGWDAVENRAELHDTLLLNVGFARDSLKKVWVAAHKTEDSTNRAHDSAEKAQKKFAEAAAAYARKDSGKLAGPGKAADSGKVSGAGATAGPGKAGDSGATKHPGAVVNAGAAGKPGGAGKVSGAGATAGPGKASDTTKPGAVFNAPKTPPPSSPGHPTGIAAAANIPAWVPLHAVPKDPPAPTLGDLIPDSLRSNILDRAIGSVNQSKTSLFQPEALYGTEAKTLLQHELAWHEKITFAVACMVMFLIGAPLGSIIRKGGIGMPLVIAVVFFVIFFLLNNFGRKLAGQAVLSPIGGMWMATYVLTPIGVFLIYKALHDSQLFNKEYYFRMTKKIRTLITRIPWKRVSKIS